MLAIDSVAQGLLESRVTQDRKHRHKTGHALFNTCLKNFLRDLIDRFPEEQDMRMVLTLYKLTKSINRKLPHSLWVNMTEPFAPGIRDHDPSFFLDEKMTLPKGFESFATMLPTIRKCYEDMNEHDQRMAWGHVDLLMHISSQLAAAGEAGA